jgi:hypothetical protein
MKLGVCVYMPLFLKKIKVSESPSFNETLGDQLRDPFNFL